MADSGEMHLEETRVLPEINKKRTLKTPAQIMALENFYSEHRFPTDEMKAQLAENLGLTEKQISSWFCHRRLKDKRRDEVYAIGRQDHSSGVIQDRGSGLRQDSCCSIKLGDYINVDHREVESQGIHSHDLSTADLTYQHRSSHDPCVGCIDDTSESSSSLHDDFFSFDMQNSTYAAQNGAFVPVSSRVSKDTSCAHLMQTGASAMRNPRNIKNLGYKPAGYLKFKGDTENPAITAVKKQLGGHYREDGPPLSIEFDSLPPRAFETPSGNLISEPAYMGDPCQYQSPDVSEELKETNPIYKLHYSKMSSWDSHMEDRDFSTALGSGRHDRKSCFQSKQKSVSLNSSSLLPYKNSSLDIYEDSAGEISVHDSCRMNSRHDAGRARSDSFPNHPNPVAGKISNGQSKRWLHDNDNFAYKNVQKNQSSTKPSNLALGSSESFETGKGTSVFVKKLDKHHVERSLGGQYFNSQSVKMHPADEVNKMIKRVKAELSQADHATTASYAKIAMLTNLSKRSSIDVPSSFSEDETAETSSSME